METNTGVYGNDFRWDGSSILPSLELNGSESVVLESVARRLQSDPGSLFYDQSYGYNILNLLKKPNTINIKLIENECLKDERVTAAICEYYFNNSTLIIQIKIELFNNKIFKLVFNINEKEVDVAYQEILNYS
jgi:hypothetical protein